MYRHRTAEAAERRNFDHVGIYFHIFFFKYFIWSNYNICLVFKKNLLSQYGNSFKVTHYFSPQNLSKIPMVDEISRTKDFS